MVGVAMNYSLQKLLDDFIRRIGEDDLRMLETVSPEVAFNYVFFLYKKFYDAYPTGELFETLYDKFSKRQAA